MEVIKKRLKESPLLKINYPIFFLFGSIMLLCILLDAFMFRDEEMPALSPIILLIAGYLFRNSLSLQVIISLFITYLRYQYIVESHMAMGAYAITWVAYFTTVRVVSLAINYYFKEKENALNLIITLAKSLDSRDSYTRNHSENVARYALRIAKEMHFSKKQCDAIYNGGLLHDIGKIGISDGVLTKPGKLTMEEYKMIQRHPVIGFELVEHISSFRKNGILDMILYHHEKFDGTGYPKGLSGTEIPLVARIIAIADTFDAMTTNRVYRGHVELETVINEIKKNRGIQFDPEVTDIFLGLIEKDKNFLERDQKM